MGSGGSPIETPIGADDPSEELAALGLALQRTLARRAIRGHRSLPRVEPASPLRGAPSGPAAQAPARRPAQAATSPSAPTPPAPAPAPPTREASARTTTPPAGPERSRPHAPAASAARAEPAADPGAAAGGPNPLAPQAAGAPDLEALRACVADCTACELSRTRSRTVFGDGQGTRRILFVGEAPGDEEDRQGVPFVGRAGALLDDIISKGMGIAREDVYIANVLKCRPPGNRDPLPSEKALCTAWLDRQIELLDPLVIIPLGRHAAGHVLGVDAPLGRLRGKIHDRNGRKVVPTYHPAYLLRSPHEKRKTWEDIQLAMGVAGLPRRGS